MIPFLVVATATPIFLGVTSPQGREAAWHVLAVGRAALGHIAWGLLGAHQRRVRLGHEVDAGVWGGVGLELAEVHIQGAVKAERFSERRGHLRGHAV
jgi:hypothetical protein